MRIPGAKQHCVRCGKEFDPPAKGRRRYCSDECAALAYFERDPKGKMRKRRKTEQERQRTALERIRRERMRGATGQSEGHPPRYVPPAPHVVVNTFVPGTIAYALLSGVSRPFSGGIENRKAQPTYPHGRYW